jgi:hypothetical protein
MHLPDAVMNYLTGGHAALISTVAEDGTPYGSVVGSTVALPDGRLRFAAWGRGKTLASIASSGVACVVTLGDNCVWALRGPAAVIKPTMDASAFPPHPYSMVEIRPQEVTDLLGGRRNTGLRHEYSDDDTGERMRRRQAILDELRSYEP